MESAKTCNRELRRQMGSSCRIIWMFPWWLEWSCTIGMEIAELHIHKDAFIAITTEVSFFFKRVNTCVDSTGRKNTSDMHTAAICWGRRRRKCSRHIETNVIRTRSCHAPPKLNIWTSTASPACVDTGAAISAWLQQPGCQLRQANTATEIQLPVRWRQQTEQLPREDVDNFSTFRGKRLHCVLICGAMSCLTYPLMQRNVHSLEGVCATSFFLNLCTHILRHARTYTKGVCLGWWGWGWWCSDRSTTLTFLWESPWACSGIEKPHQWQKHMYTHTQKERRSWV